ncbi:MAG: serpin family protein [Candidatus Pacearchaeota archaeon]
MGMPNAFGVADFFGMDGTANLQISQVIHQAFVKVDEKGTEAAAATAVGMRATAAMPRSVFRADHPFIFIIQEKGTGNILFIVRVTDPTKK